MHITIYTRHNCNKCEEMIFEKLQGTFSYTKEVINLNFQSKMDFKKHGFRYVPAIVIRNDKGEIIAKQDNLSFKKLDTLIDKAVDEIGGYM